MGKAAQSFGSLLQQLRQRARQSGNALAKAAGIDPSYLSRIERGERDPPRRELIQSLIQELRLPPADADALLVAGGHLPEAIRRLDALDPTLLLVADILADATIPAGEREELRQIIGLIGRRWRSQA